jgi:hypothetical protein
VKDAKIEQKVTFHNLRAAHASWLLAGIIVVQDRLGHRQITTTQQYTGTLPDSGCSHPVGRLMIPPPSGANTRPQSGSPCRTVGPRPDGAAPRAPARAGRIGHFAKAGDVVRQRRHWMFGLVGISRVPFYL